jgi:hypothetical protein
MGLLDALRVEQASGALRHSNGRLTTSPAPGFLADSHEPARIGGNSY